MSINLDKTEVYVKIIENLYALLVYYHLRGHININITQSKAYGTTHNSYNIGYGICYNYNWAAIIKNNIRYQIDYDSININQLYKYLNNNTFIKSMGLKVHYTGFDHDLYRYHKWKSYFRKNDKCIYLSYDNTPRGIPLFYIN